MQAASQTECAKRNRVPKGVPSKGSTNPAPDETSSRALLQSTISSGGCRRL